MRRGLWHAWSILGRITALHPGGVYYVTLPPCHIILSNNFLDLDDQLGKITDHFIIVKFNYMEHDKSTSPALPNLAGSNEKNDPESTTGNLRVEGGMTDISVLKQPISFHFSGLTAKNRFLKAPMTERANGTEKAKTS